MVTYLEGDMNANGHRMAFVVSRWNGFITERLLEGAMDAFVRHGGADDDVMVARVPGAFELAAAAQKLAESGKVDAVVCLGALIRGATPHFDYISKTTINAIMNLSVEHKKPIGNGIITCLNRAQATERSDDGEKKYLSKKNKGGEAARAVLSVLGILKNESK